MRAVLISAVLAIVVHSTAVAGRNPTAAPQPSDMLGEPRPDIPPVSMVRLLANPEKFHGKQIRVIGFLRLEFEGNALYLHREDYKERLTRNAVWVELTADKQHAKLSNHYVLIEGTFNANNLASLPLWSGTIVKVTRAERWDEPLHIRPKT